MVIKISNQPKLTSLEKKLTKRQIWSNTVWDQSDFFLKIKGSNS